jgi:hypothetical protein
VRSTRASAFPITTGAAHMANVTVLAQYRRAWRTSGILTVSTSIQKS